MKALNILSFISIFVLPVPLSILVTPRAYYMPLTYLVLLGSEVSLLSFFYFVWQYGRKRSVVQSQTYTPGSYRVCSLVASYNEDPLMVRDTIISVKLATGIGRVIVIDDSTDTSKAGELSRYCDMLHVSYVHRDNRRGYKAGAINDVLKTLDGVDIFAIFDADQRPDSNFFDEILNCFNDEKVGFVQLPQKYSENNTRIARAANYMQLPFLHTVMSGRSKADSTFSLGSGTAFRMKAVVEAGYFVEDTVTEDIATSLQIIAKGYRGVYLDRDLVYYGIAPMDARAILSQQARWSLGGFQLLGPLLRSNLPFRQFIDFMFGDLYWLKEGPIALVEIVAPIIFLALGVAYMSLSYLYYAAVFIPFFFATMIATVLIGGRDYGLKGAVMHQGVEMLNFWVITVSFFTWAMRKKKPFNVTSKKAGQVKLRSLSPNIAVLAAVSLSIAIGFLRLLNSADPIPYAINIFWAVWIDVAMAVGLYCALSSRSTEEGAVKIPDAAV
ncbi:MAG: glycosyltransferase [Thermoplasmata archaeon]|nr:glycosyltransferase [Candidatus Sysuiplasma acidicola]MBX8645890.1 glycosyltransferase [Candidatus Sysuiplasma acidicola]